MKRDITWPPLKGSMRHCVGFNLQSMLQISNQSKTMVSFFLRGSESLAVLQERLIGLLEKYSDPSVRVFFIGNKENKASFEGFIQSLNIDNYKVAEFDGDSFSM